MDRDWPVSRLSLFRFEHAALPQAACSQSASTQDGWRAGVFSGYATVGVAVVLALVLSAVSAPTRAQTTDDIRGWLLDVNRAAQQQTFVGTMVVQSGADMVSAKIWHIDHNGVALERVDLLSGEPHTTMRKGETVFGVDHANKVVRQERRSDLGLFPAVRGSAGERVAQHYVMQSLSATRVAGRATVGVALQAKDAWRHSYRIWRDVNSGLVLKWQTVSTTSGDVLEQVAYSDIAVASGIDVPQMQAWQQVPKNYMVMRKDTQSFEAGALGWQQRAPVAGFESGMVNKPRLNGQLIDGAPAQWLFSDGLASVSLFVEPLSARGQRQPSAVLLGATSSVSAAVPPMWVTAVGEAPVATLRALLASVQFQ
jgi:sigma-E factor negative regulatory protein RseB